MGDRQDCRPFQRLGRNRALVKPPVGETMRFTDEQIGKAKRLKQLGLPWHPKAGHYVLDVTGFCPQPSPFQEGVYFILNYDFFMKKVGDVDRFKEIMVWLPTWHDVRQLLWQFNVDDQHVLKTLTASDALERGEELVTLLDLLIDVLRQRQTS